LLHILLYTKYVGLTIISPDVKELCMIDQICHNMKLVIYLPGKLRHIKRSSIPAPLKF